jgi:hypothetical protein
MFSRWILAVGVSLAVSQSSWAASPSERNESETKVVVSVPSAGVTPINPSTLLDISKSRDGAGLAHALARCVYTEQQLQEKAKDYLSKMEDWANDTGGSKEDYLGARLVGIALSAAGGEPEKIQKAIQFLAMYRELGLDEPQVVVTFMKEHQGSLNRLLTDFSWAKASEYVKSKRWREDIAEMKKREEEEKARAKQREKNKDIEPTNTSYEQDR